MKWLFRVKKFLLRLSKKEAFYLWGLLTIGLWMRSYRYDLYPFGFDQVQLLQETKNILSGDLTLIGPRTGYAQIFTGPLIYYIHSVVSLVLRNVYSLVVMTLVIALTTGMVLYKLSKSYLGEKTARIILLLWAVSPYMVQLDRIPWNPNLTILAASFSFFPIFSKKIGLVETFFIFVGAALGFQAHFSGLALPILVIVASGIYRPLRDVAKIGMATTAGLLVSIIPSILFDLRNDWVNLKGLQEFFGQYNLHFEVKKTTFEMLASLWVSIENVGKLLLQHNNSTLVYFIGLVVLVLYIAMQVGRGKDGQLWKGALSWLAAVGILYGLYRGPKPEYYYLIQFPAILVLYSELFIKVIKRRSMTLILVLVAFYEIILNINVWQDTGSFSMGNQLEIAGFIKNHSKKRPISEVIYDMKFGENSGLLYLLSDISYTENGETIHVSYPEKAPYDTAVRIGLASVWVDQRGDENHVTEDDFIITYSDRMTIYKDFRSKIDFGPNTSYVVFYDGREVGRLYWLNDKNTPEAYADIRGSCKRDVVKPDCLEEWFQLIDDREGYFFPKRNFIFYYLPNEDVVGSLDTVELISLINFY